MDIWHLSALCVLHIITAQNTTTHEAIKNKKDRKFSNEPVSAEKRLVSRLLTQYKRIRQDGRPVTNDSVPVPVLFGLGLVQMELNEKDAVLILSMWTRYIWKDDYLTWDPSEYNGVSQVNLKPNNIWSPDIMLYNTADVAIEQRDALAVVKYDGTVAWYPHSIFRATCSIDIANYPFDEQRCGLAFGSWTHNSKEIDLDMGFPGGIDLGTFNNDAMDSSSWLILNVTARKSYMPSAEDDPNFAVLTFELHIRRRVVFSSYILTLPCIFLASLTLVVFWLPPERPDRIGLAMAVFSSFMVLLLILVEAAPPTAASVPKLGMYYCFNMVIIVMAVIISAAIVNISRGRKTPVSRCVQCVMLLLSKLMFISTDTLSLCCRGPPATADSPAEYTSHRSRRTPHLCSSCCMSHHTCPPDSNSMGRPPAKVQNGFLNRDIIRLAHQEPHSSQCQGNCDTQVCNWCSEKQNLNFNSREKESSVDTDDAGAHHQPDTLDCHLLCDGLRSIRKIIDKYEDKIIDTSRHEQDRNFTAKQWKETAHVLDRFIFLLYLLLISVSLAILFPKPPTE